MSRTHVNHVNVLLQNENIFREILQPEKAKQNKTETNKQCLLRNTTSFVGVRANVAYCNHTNSHD